MNSVFEESAVPAPIIIQPVLLLVHALVHSRLDFCSHTFAIISCNVMLTDSF